MTKLAIQTQNLTFDFPKGASVLDSLSIEVFQGNIFGFLGSNGSGKTTTIHLLLGLLQATSGSAKVLDFDTSTQSTEIRARTGVLLEHTGLYERLSAEDNLEYHGRIYHLSTKERRTRIKELLMCLGLWKRRHDKVGKWSRGMKQKLAIARALLHRPPLVFLDEPTAGLDPVAASALGDLLLELVKREKVTVFLTTHNLAEAEKLCDRIGIVKEGKLLATGTPRELKSYSASRKVMITGNNFDELTEKQLLSLTMINNIQIQKGHLLVDLQPSAKITPIVKYLVNKGFQVEGIRQESESLEEVFLHLMK